MFKAGLPGLPRLITALAQWLGITVMILLLEKRKSKIYSILGTLLSGIMILVLNFVIVTWLQRNTVEWIVDMVISVCFMILCIWVICEVDFFSAVGYGMVGFVAGELAASAEWLLSYWLIGGDTLLNVEAMVILIISFGGMYGLFYYLEQRISEHFTRMERRQTLIFVLVALLAMIVGNLGFYRVNYRTTVEIDAGMILAVVRTLVDFGAIAVILFLQRSWQEENVKKELTAINHMLNLQYRQYLDFKMNTEYISRQCHDLKHQIAALRNACSPEERESYLKELEAAVQQYDSQKVTGNAVLDSILTQKQMQCAQKNIQFICNADGRLLQNLAVRDISNIFCNIIDNAMECVAKYEEEEDRIIQGAVYQKNQFLIIRFENCCYEQLKFKKGIPVTTKEDKTRHGYGVTSIIYTVKKYNGHVQIKCEDNWFVIKVLIPIM